MRRLILLALLLPLAALCGCGIGAQSTPETITLPPTPPGVSTAPSSGPIVDTVFFVRDDRLRGVQRRSGMTGNLREALAQLSTGPSPAETRAGVRTALTPQPLGVLGLDDRGVLSIGVSRQFTAVTGADQLLAVAQLVWTVTQFPWVTRVRFVSGGQALEVPTDHGLVGRPVTRADYRTVAPPSGTGTATPAAPT